ncbi:MAG: VOC family protein [Micromonosporaceae bacterium]|nr:VOC family protein [Micromonosporaceae bacterium]
MTITMGSITIDCSDPRGLAEFWTKALGYEVAQDHGDGEYLMLAPLGGGTGLNFQRVPEPRTGKNRVHVDFAAEDRQAEVARLVGLAATVAAEHTVPGFGWTVLQDPEGNEFCVGDAHA